MFMDCRLRDVVMPSCPHWKYRRLTRTSLTTCTGTSHGGDNFTTLRPRQNSHFADIFKCIFFLMKMYEFRWRFYLNLMGPARDGTKPSAVTLMTRKLHIVLRIFFDYRKISNTRRTKSPNLTVYRLVLQLPLLNQMKPCAKSRMKM